MPANVETMAYAGAKPWHGLGTVLDDTDTTNWQAVLEKSGLNWDAELVPLVTQDRQQLVDRRGVRRTTDGKILGTVGMRFTVLQNRDAFQWFNPFLESKQACLHTAGSLAEGSRVWVLAKLNRDPIEVTAGDAIEKFVLLSHAHDGSLAVRVGFTPIRVVCSNTLAMAHGSEASKLIRLRHSRDILQNLDNIRDVMNLADQEFEATAEQYRRLVRKTINQADLRKYVKQVLGVDLSKPDADLATRTKNQIDEVMVLAYTGKGNDIPGVRGTLWAGYNAVTEFLSYNYGRNQDSRLNSLWFGESARTNREAFELALALAV